MTLAINKPKTIGQLQTEEKEKLQTRFDEITNWFLDNPYTHIDWEKHIEEYNVLSVKLAIMNGDKMQQNTYLNY